MKKGAPHSDPFKDVYDQISQFERDFATHDLSIAGVYFWSALRQQIFEQIFVATGAVKELLTPPSLAQGSAFRGAHFLKNLLFRNPFIRRGRFSNLIVKWARMQPVDGCIDDVIARPLRRILPEHDTIEMDVFGNYHIGTALAFSSEAIAACAWIARRVFPISLTENETAIAKMLDTEVRRRFRTDIELTTRLPTFLRDFHIKRYLFRHLLRRWQVKRLFAVVAYGHPALIAAAHDCGVCVIELQHGMIHRQHYMYDFGEDISPAYQPDKILLFGDYWCGAARYRRGLELLIYGASHIRNSLDRSRVTHPAVRRSEILFVSQSGICRDILDFALRFARQEQAYKVVFRLHPQDDGAAVRAAVAASGINPDRFELSMGGGGARTLALQAELSWQAGVYSTAILEGLSIGCRSFIIPVSGWSNLASLIDAGFAQLTPTPQDLLLALNSPACGTSNLTDVLIDRIFAAERPEVIDDLLRE